MAARKKDTSSDTQALKKAILEQEKPQEYYSVRFEKIEKQVKESLSRQATAEVLRDISL